MNKKFLFCLTLVLICTALLISCGSSSPKIPSWLQGTWTCADSGEKAVFTADNFILYDRWNNEEANISNLITEAKGEGYKVAVKNSTSGDIYTLTLINKDNNMKQDFSFTKVSDSTFSFLGYEFSK